MRQTFEPDFVVQTLLEVGLHVGDGNSVVRPFRSGTAALDRAQVERADLAEDRILRFVGIISEERNVK